MASHNFTLSDQREMNPGEVCPPPDREAEEACCGQPTGECDDHRAADASEASSCPKPLSWRGVLKRFREDAGRFVVDRGGYRLHCRSWGTGPPLYFLNGMGGTSELFALSASLLSPDFRCVLFDEFASDSVGRFGRTVTQNVVDDLFAVADTLGDDSFSLYGASLGGAVGLAAMLAQPERIERAVLQGAFAHRHVSIVEQMLITGCRFAPGRVKHLPLRTTIQRQNHLPWFPPFDYSRWKFLLEDTGSVPLRVLARRAAVAANIDLREHLTKITRPVFIIRTEGEGRIAAACQKALHEKIPNSSEERIENTGQVPFLTHPHRLIKLIGPFIKGEGTRG